MSGNVDPLDALDVIDNELSCLMDYLDETAQDAARCVACNEMGGAVNAGLALVCDAYAIGALRRVRRAIEALPVTYGPPACSGLCGSCEIPNCGDFTEI